MKKILIIFLLGLFVFTSCNDDELLNIEPESFSTVTKVYVDTPGFEAALAGLYSTVREQYMHGHVNYGFWQVGTDIAMHGTHPAGQTREQGLYLNYKPWQWWVHVALEKWVSDH